MPKFDFGWGSAPDPARGAYSAPQNSLAGGELPKNPTPASAFGLDFQSFGLQTSAPRCPPKYHYSPPPNTGAARIHTDNRMSRLLLFPSTQLLIILLPQMAASQTLTLFAPGSPGCQRLTGGLRHPFYLMGHRLKS